MFNPLVSEHVIIFFSDIIRLDSSKRESSEIDSDCEMLTDIYKRSDWQEEVFLNFLQRHISFYTINFDICKPVNSWFKICDQLYKSIFITYNKIINLIFIIYFGFSSPLSYNSTCCSKIHSFDQYYNNLWQMNNFENRWQW